jgi:hypothetical protein
MSWVGINKLAGFRDTSHLECSFQRPGMEQNERELQHCKERRSMQSAYQIRQLLDQFSIETARTVECITGTQRI